MLDKTTAEPRLRQCEKCQGAGHFIGLANRGFICAACNGSGIDPTPFDAEGGWREMDQILRQAHGF